MIQIKSVLMARSRSWINYNSLESLIGFVCQLLYLPLFDTINFVMLFRLCNNRFGNFRLMFCIEIYLEIVFARLDSDYLRVFLFLSRVNRLRFVLNSEYRLVLYS